LLGSKLLLLFSQTGYSLSRPELGLGVLESVLLSGGLILLH
jgi:hypothetical protein